MRFLAGFILGLFFIFSTLQGFAAADEDGHYVRAAKLITLRDHSVVPVGAEMEVQYDAGSDWVTGYASLIPSIPKSSATLVPTVIFNPPIDGTTNQLTAIYIRKTLTRSYGSMPIPGSNGVVIASGEPVKISKREGDFYFVDTQTLRHTMVPVASINVSQASLATGKVVAVPPLPASEPLATPVHIPPTEGQLYGKLKIPYTLRGKPLPAGSYVTIAYDAGDSWVLGGGGFQNSPRISKAAVDLIDRVNFDPPLGGRMKTSTMAYKYMPNPVNNPDSLEQSEIFANQNPSMRAGDAVYITAREGTDYLIEVPQQGMRPGRIPVSVVNVVTGDLEFGIPVVVPPIPQSINPNAAGYVIPPKSAQSPAPSAFFKRVE
jgi:hypothetical protein